MARETSDTPRRGYGRPALGSDWAADWDTLVEDLDETVVARGPKADRPASGEYDDELYLATDEQVLYRWDGTSWVTAISGGGGTSDTYTGIKEFSTEQELIDESGGLNGNGNIELDPQFVWVPTGGTVDISTPIVSSDPQSGLTFKNLSKNAELNYTGSGTLFSQTAALAFIGTTIDGESGGTIFDISGQAQIAFGFGGGPKIQDTGSGTADAGTIADGIVIADKGAIGTDTADSNLTLDSNQIIAFFQSELQAGFVELTGTVGQLVIKNCRSALLPSSEYIIDNQGTVGQISIDGYAGRTDPDPFNNIDPSDANTIVRNVYGVRDSRIAAIDSITESLSPSTTGGSVTPAEDTEMAIITPDGATTTDLAGTDERSGRSMLVVMDSGGTNSPSVTFDGVDFVGTAPSDLTAAGQSVEVQYIGTGWVKE
jgi:hypothetical protein